MNALKVLLKNGNEAILRDVRWNDLDDILEIFNSLAEEDEIIKYLGIVKKRKKKDYVITFSKIMANVTLGKEIRIVAEINGKVVGFVSIKIDGNGFRHRGWLGILIRREFRNMGLGTKMLELAIKEAKERGLKLILLETSSLNKRAIHVFKKVGFKEIGRIPKGLKINEKYVDTIIMALIL